MASWARQLIVDNQKNGAIPSFETLARIFHESAVGGPQGVGSEAYLNGTSQGSTLEDARKDGHIIRARCAPLSPASGFPVSWSQ
jgi:hypothetical protein